MIKAPDLQMMIYGVPKIDVEDLIENTEIDDYSEVDNSNWKHFLWYCEILREYSQEKLSVFLQFATG